VAAKAAEIAGDLGTESLTDALEPAFERFMANPVRDDKGCQAKTAVAEALYKTGALSADVYLRGIRHVQMEPSFGPPIDTAAKLRGLCAMGLARMAHPETMNELARLLADREADARIMAARAIAYTGDSRGEPLLRYKVYCGDQEPQVVTECFLALLRLAPDKSLEFVSSYLDSSDPELVESAAVAMGESRIAKALPPLQAAYAGTIDEAIRRALLFAIAALRCDQAVEFLLGELATASGKTAGSALASLVVLRNDPAIRRRVADIVDQRKDRQLSREFRESFES
jgi:HEAT repeat protein